MQLKTIEPLFRLCVMAFVLSGCKVPDSNNQPDTKEWTKLYHRDTVPVIESEEALLEVGLRNLATGKKHGLWYFYEGSNLVRIESFQEGIKTGPMVEFATGDDGKTSVLALAYIQDGEFTGPSIYLKADSMINFYDYYANGRSVNSMLIDGEGNVEVKLGDSTYQVGSIPIKE